jgi:hypothetical protein
MKHEMREKPHPTAGMQFIPYIALHSIYMMAFVDRMTMAAPVLRQLCPQKDSILARTTHIIVDEAQDITPLFEFISVLEHGQTPQWNRSIIIVGRGRNASESMERFGY